MSEPLVVFAVFVSCPEDRLGKLTCVTDDCLVAESHAYGLSCYGHKVSIREVALDKARKIELIPGVFGWRLWSRLPGRKFWTNQAERRITK